MAGKTQQEPEAGAPAAGSSFEDHIEALERVVGDLEGDALSLEASIDRYREGVGHLAACRRILDAAEQRLAELVATADGGTQEVPLRVGPEGLETAGPPSAPPPQPASVPPPAPPPRTAAAPAPAPKPRKSAPPLPSSAPGDDLPF